MKWQDGAQNVYIAISGMTLTGYLALNSVFVQVWLAETDRHRKYNCVKTKKIDTVLSAV